MAHTDILRVRQRTGLVFWKALPPDDLGEWRASQRAQQGLCDAIALVAADPPATPSGPALPFAAAQALGGHGAVEQIAGWLHIVVRQIAEDAWGVAVAQKDAQTTLGERILFVREYGSLAVALADVNTRYGLYLEPAAGWSPVTRPGSVSHD